jgi:hypothetical protein
VIEMTKEEIELAKGQVEDAIIEAVTAFEARTGHRVSGIAYYRIPGSDEGAPGGCPGPTYVVGLSTDPEARPIDNKM